MADGTAKKIVDIELGDQTSRGRVYAKKVEYTQNIYKYQNMVFCSGFACVKHDGQWRRVHEIDAQGFPAKLPHDIQIYSIATDMHMIDIGEFVFADMYETDFHRYVNDEESVAVLNGDIEIQGGFIDG